MIYFIENEDKEIKIGTSKDVNKRKTELNTGNSQNLRILYVLDTGKEIDYRFEKHIHEVCERYKIRGEWFNEGVIEHLLEMPFYKEKMVKYKL